MDIKHYEKLSDDLKDAISSLVTALWNTVNADTLEAIKSGIQQPKFATLLVYHLKNRASDFLTVVPNANPHKMTNYRINSKNVSAWSIHGKTPSGDSKIFTKESKIFLSVKNHDDRITDGWILIVNKEDGVFLSLSRLSLDALQNGESYFKNKYIRKQLMAWGGSIPTPQGWGIKYLYDITDYIMESGGSDFINWPLNFPTGLI
jgi:hypothetical protein